jgi:hypothetical protein
VAAIQNGEKNGLLRSTKTSLVALLLTGLLTANALGQTGNAQLGGTVQDSSKALIPGVTITVTNVETNVTQTQVSNETGAYSFPVIQPGTYRVSAQLPGFRTQIVNEVRLGVASQSRIDFTLQVGEVTSTVEVSAARDSVLRDSSASIGDVISQEQVMALPLVGNNVLDLLNILPGINISPNGERFNTVNGLGIDTINVTRDGLQLNDIRVAAQDAAYPNAGYKLFSPTTLLPDLIGEIRMILSPADAELGRGNSQIQISTRSGTNRYTGSASWNVRNTALDANTWGANNDVSTSIQAGCRIAGQTPPCWQPTRPTWNNNHQYTVSYGGPVRIPKVFDGTNKTFFYALWSQNINNARETSNVNVLTDTARQGIYRYFSGYNPVGWNTTSNAVLNPTFPLNAANASWVGVDYFGKPVAPTRNPDGSPYTGRLICFSVFGNRRLDDNGNLVPFTSADCPAGPGYTAQAVLGPASGGTWDPMRPVFDTSGYIQKYLAMTPRANYFGSNDGLNLGQYRFLRGRGGSNSTEAIVGADLYSNNKQLNLKLDQNFNANHKVAFSWTSQFDDSADNVASYPGGVNGAVVRKPYTITVNFTSTLGPRMINEARFGLNHVYNYDVYAWFNPDQSIRSKAEELLLQGSPSSLNPDYTYLAVVNNFGALNGGNGPMATTGGTNILQFNELWNYADTVSWSTGKHSLRFGGELRLPRTTGNGGVQPYPSITLGNASNTATPSPFSNATNFSTELPGLLNAVPAMSGVTVSRTMVTNMLYYLSGSVASATQPYWVTSNDNVKNGLWSDTSTHGDRLRKQIVREGALFFKDDYKISRRLTLNLGLRWEYSGAAYIDGGFTSAVVDQGYGAFGTTRTAQSTLDAFNDDPFSIWLRPGNLYLTGYGSSTTTPLSCQRGVQQNSLLPVSTCDPSSLSAIQFVGPGSPNPGVKAQPVNYYDIGPAVGFSYQVPWFGEGKTTIRAGYQQTFGSGSVNRGVLGGGTEAALGNAPGVAHQANLTITDAVFQNILATRALTLSDVKAIVPVRPTIAPGDTIPIYRRAASPTVYDPNLHTPYTQNVNFSITRQLQRNVTLDLRYVGTFARKQTGTLNLNTPNVFHNPELFQALTDARAGTCTANKYPNYTTQGINPCNINNDPVLLDQLLAGLNLNVGVAGAAPGSGTFGPVGTVNAAGVYQSGAQHLRRSGATPPGSNTSVQTSLAYGDFDAVQDVLLALAPTTAQGRQAAPINPQTGVALTGIQMIGLRNGCDRMANGYTIVQQTSPGAPQVANSGTAIPLRCFPEDWLITNPQYGSISYRTNLGHTNYHSMQANVSIRPIHGIGGQATWTWAKSMIQPTSNYMDPSRRELNFGAQNVNAHSLRMNGTVELPIGPNKFLFGSTSGWVARILERWQTSFVANVTGGAPASVSPGFAHYYTTSRYNRGPGWVVPKGKVEWNVVNPNTGAISGSYYGNPSPFMGVIDPMCLNLDSNGQPVSSPIVTRGDKMGTNLSGFGANGAVGSQGAVCNVFALAKRNPDGSQGEYLLTYSGPGTVGNSGNSNVVLFGRWTLDMNASKSFRITESKTVQVRIDATNVLNHPVPNEPTLGASNLGGIAGKGGQRRQLQGQLRVNF